MKKLLAIGEIMMEMADIGDNLYKMSFAGDTFNVAHYMNIVSGGTYNASYLTAIGEDDASQLCLEFMERHGVSTSHIIKDTKRTIGLFTLSNDEKGEKRYGYWRGQAAARFMFAKPRKLDGFDYIYLSGITAAITDYKDNLILSLRQSKSKGSKIVYDVNYRKLLWDADEARHFFNQIIDFVDIVKISDEELEVLYPSKDIRAFAMKYPEIEWVLTSAFTKAEVWKGGKKIAIKEFSPVEKVIDSSAAGDGFIATYLYSKIAGYTPQQSVARAHAIASQIVCFKGSIVPINLAKMDDE